MHGGLEYRGEVIEVLGELIEGEVLGDAVHAPGLGIGFEGADQQLAGILLVIGAAVHVAQHRQVGRQIGDRLGDDVEMLAGVQRNVHAAHQPDLAGPHAGAVDDHLAGNVAFRRRHAANPPIPGVNRRDLDVFEDFHPAGTSPLGQRHGGVGRVALAVVGKVDAPQQVVGV